MCFGLTACSSPWLDQILISDIGVDVACNVSTGSCVYSKITERAVQNLPMESEKTDTP